MQVQLRTYMKQNYYSTSERVSERVTTATVVDPKSKHMGRSLEQVLTLRIRPNFLMSNFIFVTFKHA
jgi:hypothetical protein